MSDYQRIARVIDFLVEHRARQPSLDELADLVGLSSYHFQRLFTRWAGVTPKKFLQCLTVEAARQQLKAGSSVLDSALEAGLSGPGRLHDLTISLESASPGELKSGGAGWEIVLGFAETPFGTCLLAESPRGICALQFVEQTNRHDAEQQLSRDWFGASLRWNQAHIKQLATEIFTAANPPKAVRSNGKRTEGLRCLVKGTQFQTQVWRALLSIPPGQVTTYGKIAAAIGRPTASRAVGTAVGQNTIGYLIPCHRVIRGTGVIGDYRWGSTRKRMLLGQEFASCTES